MRQLVVSAHLQAGSPTEVQGSLFVPNVSVLTDEVLTIPELPPSGS
jgi:hypothetical protein